MGHAQAHVAVGPRRADLHGTAFDVEPAQVEELHARFHVLVAVAVDLLELAVADHQAVLGVIDDDGLRHVLDGIEQARFRLGGQTLGLAQGFLVALALGDVVLDAADADHRALRIHHREAHDGEFAIAAGKRDRQFPLDHLTSFDDPAVVFRRLLGQRPVQHIEDGLAADVLAAGPVVILVLAVDQDEVAVPVPEEHACRHVVDHRRQALLALAQRLLHPFLLRRVAEIGRDDVLVLGLARGDGDVDGELAAVGAHGGQLDALAEDRALAGFDEMPEGLAVRLAQAGRDHQLDHALADHRGAAVAEGPLRRPVELQNAPLAVDRDDAVERRIEDRALQRLAFAQRLFRRLAVGDVGADQADGHDRPVRAENRELDVAEGALALRRRHPLLPFELPLRRQHSLVVRGQRISDPFGKQLVRRVPDDLVAGQLVQPFVLAVHEDVAALHVLQGNDRRGVVGHGLETRLGLPQGLHRPHAVGHVAAVDVDVGLARNRRDGEGERAAAGQDVDAAPVAAGRGLPRRLGHGGGQAPRAVALDQAFRVPGGLVGIEHLPRVGHAQGRAGVVLTEVREVDRLAPGGHLLGDVVAEEVQVGLAGHRDDAEGVALLGGLVGRLADDVRFGGDADDPQQVVVHPPLPGPVEQPFERQRRPIGVEHGALLGDPQHGVGVLVGQAGELPGAAQLGVHHHRADAGGSAPAAHATASAAGTTGASRRPAGPRSFAKDKSIHPTQAARHPPRAAICRSGAAGAFVRRRHAPDMSITRRAL